MTSLEKRKTRLVFTTCDTVRQRGRLREVVLECKPYFAMVRLAGMRSSFAISYATIYQTAARIKAERERAEKKAAKKKGRRRKGGEESKTSGALKRGRVRGTIGIRR